jgi:hypothetical protein
MAKRKGIAKPSAAAEKAASTELVSLAAGTCLQQCVYKCGTDLRWHLNSDNCPSCNCTCSAPGGLEGSPCSPPGSLWAFPCNDGTAPALAAAAKGKVPEPDHVITVLPGQNIQIRFK